MKSILTLGNTVNSILKLISSFSLKLAIIFLLISSVAKAQVAGDFQTKSATGNWSDFNAWNIHNGAAFVPAVSGQLPTATSSVFIQAGHTINVDVATAVCNNMNANGSTASKVAFSTATAILNVKGNFVLASTLHVVFGTWTAGAKIVFSGAGTQTITNQNANYSFQNLEINKPAGSIFNNSAATLKYDVLTLTSGTFNVGMGQELRGLSSSSTVTVDGGIWNQTANNTRINGGTGASHDIVLTINSGTMTLATTSGAAAGFNFSAVNISNGGILNLNNFTGNINIINSLSVDATSTLNTALTNTPIPATHTLSGLVNYNHTGAQNIAAATYSNLRLSGTSVKTLLGTTNIAAGGKLEMSGVSTSPTLALGAGTLNVSATNTTLIYSSTGTQTATATEWSSNFKNVTINNGSVSGVSMAGLTRSITGILTLTAGTLNIGAAGALTLNGADLVRTAGFIDGTNTSDLTVTGTAVGAVNLPTNANISLRNVTISGNRIFAMNGIHHISLSGAFSIASGATFDTGGESQVINNTGGTVTIDGTFITKDVQGFTGTNASIPGIVPVLNTGCTIEYGFAGNQAISIRPDYYNLKFTNGGVKSPVSASPITPIAGTVTIKDTTNVDVANNSFGNGSTNLTMTETAKFINGGSGVKPDMGGTYTLDIGSTIEFGYTSATDIRLAPNYANILISGTNISTSSLTQGIKFKPGGGSFTVKNAATFKVLNTDGFSGSTTTAIDNTNSPAIILKPGSTIEYIGANQTITNQTINTPSNANYEGFTLSGTGIKTAPGTTLTINGNLTKSGTTSFVHSSGKVVMNGTATQAYNATAPVMDFYDLTNNNIADFTINNDLTVAREFAFGASSKLNFEDGNITLLSNSANTANVGIIPSTASITYSSNGRFIVERYIPTGITHGKSWQFLSAPTVGQTIKESWMENGLITSTANGYGTWITGVGGTVAGFDATSSVPSMKSYVPALNTWLTVADPSVTSISNARGYMIFVRGDRSVYNLSGLNSAAVATVLRTKGSILKGDQPLIPVASGQFESIGNPYASAIDLTQLTLNEAGGGVQDFFYVWDPKLTNTPNSMYGFGGYQLFSRNGSTYDVTPGGATSSYPTEICKTIESGQAFFVNAPLSAGTVRFKEACKTGGSNVVTKPAGSPDNGPVKQLRTNLYVMVNGNAILVDGNRVQFDASWSNNIDAADAVKLMNTGENLGMERNAKNLVVERRALIQKADTIFYKLGQLKPQQYQFRFLAAGISRPGLKAFLEDNFLGTKTAVSLADTATISFNISNDPRSYAADRFRLVFQQKEKNAPGTTHDNEPVIINPISVFPNPVIDKVIRLQFNDQPAGKYDVQLISQSGQTVMQQAITVTGNRFATSLFVPNIAAGTYQLTTSSGKIRHNLQVIIK